MADKKPKEPVVYTKSTAQLDAERRSSDDYVSPLLVHHEAEKPNYDVPPDADQAQYATEDTVVSEYRGVSPEYMTYSDDTSKPLGGGWTDEVADEDESGVKEDGDEDGEKAAASTTTSAKPAAKPTVARPGK